MLDGFVAPHAHFRVFHGDRAPASRRNTTRDQFPSICFTPSSAESVTAASDQHLREFAQLEAQVKAAQQQQVSATGASSSVNARTLADVNAGALAECFAFYTRLLTIESFTWPDFLATVFTKLAEHFANSANESVRSAILAVFQQSKAHVAQVNDPSKLIAHLLPVLTTSPSAQAHALTLQLLETMPSLLQNDAAVQFQLLSRLYAEDSGERAAAIAATRALLPLVPALHDAASELIFSSKDKTNADASRTLKIDLSELANDGNDGEDGADTSRSSLTRQLLKLLHPSRFERSSAAWTNTLACVEELCVELPDSVPAQVVPCLFELVELANALKLSVMKKSLFSALARVAELSADDMAEHSQLLLRELGSLKADENCNRLALASILFRVLQCSSSGEANDIKKEVGRILADASYTTHADRYEVAKVAIVHGHFRLAHDLTTAVAAATDKESFGGWLQALRAFSDAEALVLLDTRVGLSSIYQLSRATTYLKAAVTSRNGFEFQLRVVQSRLQWSQLVLQAQQFAGEAEFSNTRGAGREEALRDRFEAVASQFRSLRSTLLGASAADLDALEGHARISELLATAIDSFLLLDSDASSGYGGVLDSQQTKSHLWRTCEALDADIREKSEILERIAASRRAALGGRVMTQLLKTVCSVPCALPQLFFQLTPRSPEQRIASNAQFLTSAENLAFTSKPRPRSQLGVPFGTDFNSLLKGGIEVDSGAKSYWQEMVASLEIEVLVNLVDKTAAPRTSSAGKSFIEDQDKNVFARIHKHVPVDWSKAVQQCTTTGSSSLLYLPFETAVHVRAESLRVKGSFQ
ncbi:hypothetical protein Gpo141_00013384, partial [Globisporangium polare]